MHVNYGALAYPAVVAVFALIAAVWNGCVRWRNWRLRKSGRLTPRQELEFGRIWMHYDREAQEPSRDSETGEAA